MGWLRTRRIDRAAKDYARRMAPWLQCSFGHSDRYTVAQIRTAATTLKLDGDFIVLGYATFLAQEEFDALPTAVKGPLAYDDARALLARFIPPRLFSAPGEATKNAYASGGAGAGYTTASPGGDANVGN